MQEHTEQRKEIVICKYCNKPEYLGVMRLFSGRFACRNCYQFFYNAQYVWNDFFWEVHNHKCIREDLDGPRPTMEEYKEQEARKCENTN